MSAQIISLNAWKATRKTGSRRLDPIRQEIRELRSQMDDDRQKLGRWGAECEHLQVRLDENITRQGKNRGRPLSETNRYQLSNALKNLQSDTAELEESETGNNSRLSVLLQELERAQREKSQ